MAFSSVVIFFGQPLCLVWDFVFNSEVTGTEIGLELDFFSVLLLEKTIMCFLYFGSFFCVFSACSFFLFVRLRTHLFGYFCFLFSQLSAILIN